MAYKCDILLGRITKVSGYEGAVAIKLEKSFIENVPHMESVYLEIEGRPVPFFITGNEYSGADILRLQFEGYDTVEKITEFTGCRVFLTSGIEEDNLPVINTGITGYMVFDGEKLLGSVTGVIENPGQWLITVKSTGKKELLIPFHEDLIISINKKKKVIIMEIPEGLTEIN